MALKLSVQTFGKKDGLGFLPADLVKNFAAYTGRKVRSEEQIEKMVQSLLAHGQEVNFTYRKGFNDEPIPVTGHTRILAANLINKRKLKGFAGGNVEVQFGPDNPFIVYGNYKQYNELEAVIHTFVENDEDTRTPLNDMDMADLIRTLGDTFGMSDGDIAKKLDKLPSWVSTHRALLDLDAESQKKVRSGELKFNHAQTLLKVEPAKRAETIATAKKNGNGKITAAGLASAATEVGAKTKGSTARSLKELRDAIKPVADGASGPAKVRALALWDFLSGRGSAQDLVDALGNSKKAAA